MEAEINEEMEMDEVMSNGVNYNGLLVSCGNEIGVVRRCFKNSQIEIEIVSEDGQSEITETKIVNMVDVKYENPNIGDMIRVVEGEDVNETGEVSGEDGDEINVKLVRDDSYRSYPIGSVCKLWQNLQNDDF